MVAPLPPWSCHWNMRWRINCHLFAGCMAPRQLTKPVFFYYIIALLKRTPVFERRTGSAFFGWRNLRPFLFYLEAGNLHACFPFWEAGNRRAWASVCGKIGRPSGRTPDRHFSRAVIPYRPVSFAWSWLDASSRIWLIPDDIHRKHWPQPASYKRWFLRPGCWSIQNPYQWG